MQFTACTEDFTVVDDLLSPADFQNLWRSVQALKYDFPAAEWMRLWPLSDPQPVMSGPFNWSLRPCGYGLDHYIEQFKACIESDRSCLSNIKDWSDIAFRVFLHARGSRMVAHADTPKYVGAGVFYVHPDWRPNWGGEICFPSMAPDTDYSRTSVGGDSLTNGVINDAIQMRALGSYVSPKPNRLVLIRGGVVHYTNRVDVDAGAALRCSITSFLVPEGRQWDTSARKTFSLD